MLLYDDFPNYAYYAKHNPELTEEAYEAYVQSLNEHIFYVKQAGLKLGVESELLNCHDKSKWTAAEFPHYAMNFHGEIDVVDKFAVAWLHHIHHNEHHWQHWIFPDHYTPKNSNLENGVIEMPKQYALEMVADWMGASKVYTASWDMADWLAKHMGRIIVHSNTAAYLRGILDGLGYADIIYMRKFKNE